MWKLIHISVVADGPRVIWRYIYRGVSTIFFFIFRYHQIQCTCSFKIELD